MTDIWVPGIDEIISLFDDYRAAQMAIRQQCDRLESCAPRETARLSPNMIHAAQEVPELQRLIEKEESIREEIVKQCKDAGGLMDQVYVLYYLLTDDKQQRIILLYYFECLPMDEVAAKMRYCRRSCWRIRTDAFRLMAETWHTCAH